MIKIPTEYEGFYTCNDYPYFAANEEGTIISIPDGKTLHTSDPRLDIEDPIKTEYSSISHTQISYRAHIVIAAIFHEKPILEEGQTLVVNHDNGRKSDNRPANLAWMSQSQNTFHAYQTGLNWRSVHVWLKDLRTGEITEHYSIRDAARHCRRSHVEISKWLSGRRDFPFQRVFDISGAGLAFSGFTEKDIGSAFRTMDSVVVINFNNGDKLRFEDSKAAAEYIGIKYHTLTKRLQHDMIRLHHGYQTCWSRAYKGDLNELTLIEKPKRIKTGGSQRIPVVLKTPLGEVVERWPSRQAMAEHYEVHPTTLSNIIAREGMYRGMYIEYEEKVPTTYVAK